MQTSVLYAATDVATLCLERDCYGRSKLRPPVGELVGAHPGISYNDEHPGLVDTLEQGIGVDANPVFHTRVKEFIDAVVKRVRLKFFEV